MVEGDMQTIGTLVVSGQTNLNSGLIVSDKTNLNNGLRVGGATNLDDRIEVSGPAKFNGGIEVSGPAQFNDDLIIWGGLTVNQYMTTSALEVGGWYLSMSTTKIDGGDAIVLGFSTSPGGEITSGIGYTNVYTYALNNGSWKRIPS